jgi:hypothetical protein
MSRFVFIAPLLLITSFAWFNYSYQKSDDPLISANHATSLTANQSERMDAYSATDRAPEQLGDPDKKTTKPTPEDLASVDATSPDPEERKKGERLVMPEWEKIFNPNGTLRDEVNRRGTTTANGVPDYIDIYKADYAEFILEEISEGVATDMSALLPAAKISDEVIYRGEVSAAHDLGHVYYMRSTGKDDHARMYVGIERLSVPVDSFIEIEFNQMPVRVGSGNPWWQLNGERKDGDLLARINLTRGQPSFVEFEEWQGGAYALLDSYNGSPGHGCVRQPAFMYCAGAPPIEHPTQGFEAWDSEFQPVEITPPDNFLQLGFDLKRLLDFNRDFSGILIRTPEDIVVKGFRVSRQTAYLDQ